MDEIDLDADNIQPGINVIKNLRTKIFRRRRSTIENTKNNVKNKSMDNIETLSKLIAKAARKAFLKLFENGEHFYYCVLLTTGEGFSPIISAWSWEALDRISNEYSEEDRIAIKLSYADSPYYDFGDEYFNDVRQVFHNYSTIDQLDDKSWSQELKYRLDAMELAMKQLDNDGIFGITKPRETVYINVELMPPDFSNIERALRLNKSQNITDWLNEAAEDEET